jgi:RNA polymerase sigma-70 factor, ECF subfamily
MTDALLEIPLVDTTDTFAVMMRLALKGDAQAYACLLKETSRLLRPFLSKRLSFTNEVDDLMQEILLSIHKARHTYDGNRPYKPWAFAIAKFRLHDYLRAHYADQLHRAVDFDDLAESLPEPVTETTLSYESISEIIKLLPDKQAIILQLIHQQGFTAKEVAAQIGMQESAVKVSAHRAYKVLREKLEQDHGAY